MTDMGYHIIYVFFIMILLFVPASSSCQNEPQYIGCWKEDDGFSIDRAFSEQFDDFHDDATIQNCLQWCRERGFTYAGTQNSDECFCGESYDRYGKADEADCDKRCEDDGSQCCGGDRRISVYTVCPLGFHGSGCEMSCPEHCKENKCRFDGSCFDCDTGFLGTLCDEACTAGTYGDKCAHYCPGFCKTEPCLATSLDGECPGGLCQAGYQGNSCTEDCEEGQYGENCMGRCSKFCKYQNCYPNSTDGRCLWETCAPGYQGSNCTNECSHGRYGEECGESCPSCRLGCHHVTGVCITCPDNHTECAETCVMGTYGENCTDSCPSCQDGCHYITGVCLHECPEDQDGCTSMSQEGGNLVPIIATVAVISTVLLVSVIVIIIVLKRRKKSQSESNEIVKLESSGKNGAPVIETDKMVDNEIYGENEKGDYVKKTPATQPKDNVDAYELQVMVDNDLYDENKETYYTQPAKKDASTTAEGMVENEMYEDNTDASTTAEGMIENEMYEDKTAPAYQNVGTTEGDRDPSDSPTRELYSIV